MDLDFASPQFWIAVGQIIMIDILLGGDNAVVIALACRRLDPKRRKLGILWGTAGAIALRVVLIFFALTLLAIPFLKIIGALLLLWIGVKLLVRSFRCRARRRRSSIVTYTHDGRPWRARQHSPQPVHWKRNPLA